MVHRQYVYHQLTHKEINTVVKDMRQKRKSLNALPRQRVWWPVKQQIKWLSIRKKELHTCLIWIRTHKDKCHVCKYSGASLLVFKHITEQFLHGSVSNSSVKEQQLYPLRCHKAQRGKKEKQLSKPANKHTKYINTFPSQKSTTLFLWLSAVRAL